MSYLVDYLLHNQYQKESGDYLIRYLVAFFIVNTKRKVTWSTVDHHPSRHQEVQRLQKLIDKTIRLELIHFFSVICQVQTFN